MILKKIERLAEDVTDGKTDPLKTFVTLKRIEKALKSAMETVLPEAVDEAAKHGKSFELFGAEIQCKSAAPTWNFKHIQQWVDLKESLVNFEKSKKASYKAVHLSGKLIVSRDGEVEVMPKYLPGKDTISVRLKSK